MHAFLCTNPNKSTYVFLLSSCLFSLFLPPIPPFLCSSMLASYEIISFLSASCLPNPIALLLSSVSPLSIFSLVMMMMIMATLPGLKSERRLQPAMVPPECLAAPHHFLAIAAPPRLPQRLTGSCLALQFKLAYLRWPGAAAWGADLEEAGFTQVRSPTIYAGRCCTQQP